MSLTRSQLIGLGIQTWPIGAALGYPDSRVQRFSKEGYIDGVNGTEIDINSLGQTVTYPETAATISVVSSSANDTATGTGARTVRITALDANFDTFQETVTLNGTTPVTTTATALRVQRMQVLTSGSGIYNDGDITATIDGGFVNGIAAGFNIEQSAHWTVPNGYALLVNNAVWATQEDQDAECRIRIRQFDLVEQVRRPEFVALVVNVNGSSGLVYDQSFSPLFVPPKDDIRHTAVNVGVGQDIAVTIGYTGILVPLELVNLDTDRTISSF